MIQWVFFSFVLNIFLKFRGSELCVLSVAEFLFKRIKTNKYLNQLVLVFCGFLDISWPLLWVTAWHFRCVSTHINGRP